MAVTQEQNFAHSSKAHALTEPLLTDGYKQYSSAPGMQIVSQKSKRKYQNINVTYFVSLQFNIKQS